MAQSNIGTAYVQILPTTKGIKNELTSQLSSPISATGQSMGAKLGGTMTKALGAAAAIGIGAALVSGIKKGIEEGGKLEQSIGGIETLFKDSSDTVIKNAANAWKTAGISANEYMEQTTSIAAALVKSVGGDTEKAANAADIALQDMADNANKLGTPLESIQNAYQGFAKGQYQLLDNLKLGYGGTKTEMQRLLADATKLTGQKYDIENLNDVYSAIHVIQGELGITGTTAKEAASTIQGSAAAMKASWTNFLGTLATGGSIQSIGESMANLAESAGTFLFKNLTPMVARIVGSLPEVISTLLIKGVPKLLGAIDSMGEMIVAHAPEILKTIGNITGQVLVAIGQLTIKIGAKLLELLPKLPGIALKFVKYFAQGLLSSPILDKFNQIKNGIVAKITAARDAIRNIVEKIKSFFNFKITLPHIKLPHFSINPSGWKIGDLLKGEIPSLGINWYAKGGIVEKPSIIGAGEAGPEAIIPLKKLDQMTNKRNTTDPAILAEMLQTMQRMVTLQKMQLEKR